MLRLLNVFAGREIAMGKTAKKADPKLWQKVKAEVTEGDKGGRSGQWSARKAQMAVQDYKKEGGGYIGPKQEDNALTVWTQEDWGTKGGGKSVDTGERYLLKKARKALSPGEYAETTAKKRHDTAMGRQFSSQPAEIARKTAPYRHRGADGESKQVLMQQTRDLGIEGRSRMTKAQLSRAIAAAQTK
jgi:hypothetical protein